MRGRGGYAYRQYNNRPGMNYRSAPSQYHNRNRNRPNPQNNGGRSNNNNQGQQSQTQPATVAAN
jgi:hypothetical protein